MLEQGPRSPEEELKKQIAAFIENVLSESTTIATLDNRDEQIDFVRVIASAHGLKLNNKQIQKIIEEQNSTVDEIMKLQTAPSNPHVRLAVQIALATAVATWKPSISASMLSNFALRQTLHGLFDEHLGLYNKAIDLALMVAMLGFSNYSLHSLTSSTIEQIEETFGKMVATLAIPAAMILYNKAPAILATIAQSETVEVAGDFFDLMYGRADDETYEKYHGSLATMTFEDMASGIGSTLSWVWNKLPSLRSQAPSVLTLPDASQASTISLTDTTRHETHPSRTTRRPFHPQS